MPSRLSDHLRAARRRDIVGRAAEKELFLSALSASPSSIFVLYIHGPGGVGKTTLLHEFAHLADQNGAATIYIDARNVEAAPDAFLNALGTALGIPPTDSPLNALTNRAGKQVLLIDTFELLTPLDSWLRESFLPQLPDTVLTVFAGRTPPAVDWVRDPGWRSLVRFLSLRNFSPEESRDYLSRRGIGADEHKEILDFTHGHPLALSLVADVLNQRPNQQFESTADPDIVKVLLERLVQKVPSLAHRAALEACALVWIMTESLLAEMLTIPDASELFEWLWGLSIIDTGARGLFPHDLARDALTANLRWRNPDWFAELHKRARNYYTRRLQETQGREQRQVLLDYIYLHRDNPAVRPYFEWQESASIWADSLRDEDVPVLVSLIERHEGAESARLAAHWLDRQPEAVRIFRSAQQKIAGFLLALRLDTEVAADGAEDPAVQAAWRYLQNHAPLRAGERATIFRFWMDGELYQAISSTQSRIFLHAVQHYLTTPGLAFTFFPCAEPDMWTPVFAYADLMRIPAADFSVGGRQYGVYGHDWRTMPPLAWLDLLAERELAADLPDEQTATAPSDVQILDEDAFAAAVWDALRDLHNPAQLRTNPLLHTRLLVREAGPDAGEQARIAALQTRIQRTIESLQATPRQLRLYRALHHTYVQPAATQELAAELLDLPFSTYRRHLRSGIDRVAELLWQEEIAGGD